MLINFTSVVLLCLVLYHQISFMSFHHQRSWGPPGPPLQLPPSVLLLLFIHVCAGPIDTVLGSTSPVTGPYEQPSTSADAVTLAVSTLTITQATEIAGTLIWSQSPFTGQLFTVSKAQATVGQFNITLPIILPHSLDDRYGCTPFTHAVNDEGQPLAGSIVLIERRGGCAFAAKETNVAVTGAAGVAIHNCVGCSFGLIRIAVPNNVTIASMFLTTTDGFILRNYLQARRDWLKNVALNPSYQMPTGHNYTLPVMGTVVGTGPMDPTELVAFKKIATEMSITYPTLSDTTALRPWSDLLSNPNLDPCTNRMVGIYCERGHIQSIYLHQLKMTGSFSSSWGAFTSLKYLTMNENTPDTIGFTGSLPTHFCQLTQLISIQLEGNSLTSLPNCMGTNLTNLLVLSIDRNALTTLPVDVSGLTGLLWFTASSNLLTTIPVGINQWSMINNFDVSSNSQLNMDVSPLSFSLWSQAYQINLANCAFNGQFQSTAFDDLYLISSLDLSHNSLSGVIPDFNGTPLTSLDLSHNSYAGSLTIPTSFNSTLTSLNLGYNSLTGLVGHFSQLTSLNLQFNNFTGDLPTSFNTMPLLTSLTMDHNQLTGPLITLSSIPTLTIAHFEHNSLEVPTWMAGDVGEMIESMVGPGLVELYLDYNSLGPNWNNSWLETEPRFVKLSMSHNQLKNLPPNLWFTTLTVIDFSYNLLVGSIPDGINSDTSRPFVSYFNVEGNLNLNSVLVLQSTGALSLPTWLQVGSPISYILHIGILHYCPSLISPTSSSFRFVFSDSLTSYYGCQCTTRSFGSAPNCFFVPNEIIIRPTATGLTKLSLDDNDPPYLDHLIQYDNGNSTTANTTDLGSVVLPAAFTDGWFGLDAVSTSWTINLESIRRSQMSGIESFNNTLVSQSLINSDADLQPVRSITIRFHLSTRSFINTTNSIAVTSDSQTDVAHHIVGTDYSTSQPAAAHSDLVNSPQYQQRYGDYVFTVLNETINSSRVVEVTVFSNQATIQISSTDVSFAHFVGTYTWSESCPSGYLLDSRTNTCSERNTSGPSSSSSGILGIGLGVAALLIIGVFIWLIRERMIRQRAKQSKTLGLSLAIDGNITQLDDLSPEQFAKLTQSRHIHDMKLEIVYSFVTLCVEIGLIVTTWINVKVLVNEDATISDLIVVFYLVVAIVSTMAFLVNSATRLMGMIFLYEAIKRESSEGQDDRVHALGKLERQIYELKMIGVGLLFDSILILTLNLYRSYHASTGDGTKLASLTLSATLIGYKIAKLQRFNGLKDERIKLQYEITQTKKDQNLKNVDGFTLSNPVKVKGTELLDENGVTPSVPKAVELVPYVHPASPSNIHPTKKEAVVEATSMDVHPSNVHIHVFGDDDEDNEVHEQVNLSDNNKELAHITHERNEHREALTTLVEEYKKIEEQNSQLQHEVAALKMTEVQKAAVAHPTGTSTTNSVSSPSGLSPLDTPPDETMTGSALFKPVSSGSSSTFRIRQDVNPRRVMNSNRVRPQFN